jgi:hypothetical protein
MYFEPEQKEQGALQLGVRADIFPDYIELDPDVQVKYEAMAKSGLIQAIQSKDD